MTEVEAYRLGRAQGDLDGQTASSYIAGNDAVQTALSDIYGRGYATGYYDGQTAHRRQQWDTLTTHP